MTKKVKKIVLIALVMLMVVLSACYPPQYKWKISYQVNTQWISQDGTIVLNVDDNRMVTGTMEVSGEVIEIYVATETAAGAGLHIYPLEVSTGDGPISEADRIEYWLCSYKSEKKIVATVKKNYLL